MISCAPFYFRPAYRLCTRPRPSMLPPICSIVIPSNLCSLSPPFKYFLVAHLPMAIYLSMGVASTQTSHLAPPTSSLRDPRLVCFLVIPSTIKDTVASIFPPTVSSSLDTSYSTRHLFLSLNYEPLPKSLTLISYRTSLRPLPLCLSLLALSHHHLSCRLP